MIGAVVAILMARGWGRGSGRAALLAFGWTAAMTLAVVIPDFRVLVVVAYAPILLIGAPFGWPPGARFFDAIPWPVLNQAICVLGGLAWATPRSMNVATSASRVESSDTPVTGFSGRTWSVSS